MSKSNLSVVVPVYNVEKYLGECIDSIINQTYRELEIILVDDGSTDSSGLICDRYADKDARIKVIHQENMGLIMARYNGAMSASNDYVTFVDGDDWVHLDTYNCLAQYMIEGYDVIVYSHVLYFPQKACRKVSIGIREGSYTKKQIRDEIYPKLIWDCGKDDFGMDPSMCLKIMKRGLVLRNLESVQGLNFYYGEDFAVACPVVLEAESLFAVDQHFYYYRQRNMDEVAPYVRDENFFEKLLTLYLYLKKRMDGNSELIKQLEYMYIKAVTERRKVYGDYVTFKQYLFPFGKVGSSSKVVLYGAGIVGKAYYKQIEKTDYCEIVAWVDKRYDSYTSLGVKPIDYVTQVSFDYIVIANASEESSAEIKRELIGMGIDERNIVCGHV